MQKFIDTRLSFYLIYILSELSDVFRVKYFIQSFNENVDSLIRYKQSSVGPLCRNNNRIVGTQNLSVSFEKYRVSLINTSSQFNTED